MHTFVNKRPDSAPGCYKNISFYEHPRFLSKAFRFLSDAYIHNTSLFTACWVFYLTALIFYSEFIQAAFRFLFVFLSGIYLGIYCTNVCFFIWVFIRNLLDTDLFFITCFISRLLSHYSPFICFFYPEPTESPFVFYLRAPAWLGPPQFVAPWASPVGAVAAPGGSPNAGFDAQMGQNGAQGGANGTSKCRP